MLIDGCKIFFTRCPVCSRLMKYDFNVFEVMWKEKVEYRCKCDNINIILEKRNHKYITIIIDCFDCGNKHLYNLRLKDILKDINTMYCFLGEEICILSSKEIDKHLIAVKGINKRKYNKKTSSEDYFNNFKIFSLALEKLYTLNRLNKIDCNCGNAKIDVEIFPDRIELKCSNCNSIKLIFAETEEDLSVLLEKDKILLKENNISCIDSINENNRDIKK